MIIFDWLLGRHRTQDSGAGGASNQAQVDQNSSDINDLFTNKRDKTMQRFSIEDKQGFLQFKNDENAPTPYKLYGVDKNGVKGYKFQEFVHSGSFRFKIRNDRWYGFSSSLGINYYNAGSYYGGGTPATDPNPNYRMMGFVAPFNCKIKKIIISNNRMNNGTRTVHLALVKQTKTNGSTTIQNAVLHKDTTGVAVSQNKYNAPIEIDVNTNFNKFEVLGVMFNKSGAGTGIYYMYSDLTIIYERI